MFEHIETSADNLWLAANGIRILNSITLLVRCSDITAMHELS